MIDPLGNAVAYAKPSAGDRIWTERAASYGWNVDATLSSRLKIELTMKYLSSQARVCDVGCGNGLFLRVLAPHCAQATGIDLNAQMLKEARAMVSREVLSNVELAQCRADAMPFPNAAFDLVYCFSTLLLIPDIDAALSQMVRTLVRGGYLILDVAGRNNLSALYWWLWYRRRGHFGIRTFSLSAIEGKLERLGCRIVERHALGFCDQWKYIPGLHFAKFLDQVFHASVEPTENLDYRVSNLSGIFHLANRWYIVARKDEKP